MGLYRHSKANVGPQKVRFTSKDGQRVHAGATVFVFAAVALLATSVRANQIPDTNPATDEPQLSASEPRPSGLRLETSVVGENDRIGVRVRATDYVELAASHVYGGREGIFERATLARVTVIPVATRHRGVLDVDGLLRLGLGGGHLPRMFAVGINTNQRQATPASLAFLALDGGLSLGRALLPANSSGRLSAGTDVQLTSRLHGVGTAPYLSGSRTPDRASARGLTYFDFDSSLGLGHAMLGGNLRLTADLGARLNLSYMLDLARTTTFANTPLSVYAETGLEERVPGIATVRAAAHLPLRSKTNTLPMHPTVGVHVRFDAVAVPDLRLIADLGLGQVSEAAIAWSVPLDRRERWQVGASGGLLHPQDSTQVNWRIGVGLSFAMGKDNDPPPIRDGFGWDPAALNSTQRREQQHVVVQPHMRHYFGLAESGTIVTAAKEQDWQTVDASLNSPERIIAFVADNVDYWVERTQAGGGVGPQAALSPESTLAEMRGVCRDQHYLGVYLMRRQGTEAVQLGYSSAGTGHAIGVYKDAETGKYNAWENGHIHHVQADTPRGALASVKTDWLEIHPYDAPERSDENGRLNGTQWRHPSVVRQYFEFATARGALGGLF